MLASVNYVPILKAKSAEVSAYRNLSDSVKDVMLPAFFARPWQNANELDFTFNKLSEATDGRPFALGLDPDRRGHASNKPAQHQFDALFAPTGGFRAYFDALRAVDGAVPILVPSSSSDNLLIQLGHATELDRGLIVHMTQSSAIPVLNIAATTPPLPHDTIFIVDAGWSRNYELLEVWAVRTVERITSALPDAEIVVAASSFPDSFSHIVGAGSSHALERRLFTALRLRFNQANLTYGDWGSTRLPQSGGGGEIPPRVDIPRIGGWDIFRAAPGGDETYSDMALAALSGPAFAAAPDCYGKQMVEQTPTDGVITGPAMCTIARINMHMTINSDAANTMDTANSDYED